MRAATSSFFTARLLTPLHYLSARALFFCTARSRALLIFIFSNEPQMSFRVYLNYMLSFAPLFLRTRLAHCPPPCRSRALRSLFSASISHSPQLTRVYTRIIFILPVYDYLFVSLSRVPHIHPVSFLSQIPSLSLVVSHMYALT